MSASGGDVKHLARVLGSDVVVDSLPAGSTLVDGFGTVRGGPYVRNSYARGAS